MERDDKLTYGPMVGETSVRDSACSQFSNLAMRRRVSLDEMGNIYVDGCCIAAIDVHCEKTSIIVYNAPDDDNEASHVIELHGLPTHVSNV